MSKQTIEASVTVDGVEYTATLDRVDGSVSISQSVDPSTGRYDGRAYIVGEGRWDGSSIQDCGADLGDEVYEALDEAMSDAVSDAGPLVISVPDAREEHAAEVAS